MLWTGWVAEVQCPLQHHSHLLASLTKHPTGPANFSPCFFWQHPGRWPLHPHPPASETSLRLGPRTSQATFTPREPSPVASTHFQNGGAHTSALMNARLTTHSPAPLHHLATGGTWNLLSSSGPAPSPHQWLSQQPAPNLPPRAVQPPPSQ